MPQDISPSRAPHQQTPREQIPDEQADGPAPGVDDDALRATLAEVERRTHDPGATSADTVGRLLTAATELLGVPGAALMLAGTQQDLRCVAWTDDSLRRLEQAEEEVVSGPALDAHVLGTTIATADVTVDPRWVPLGELLRRPPADGTRAAPVHGVLTAPVVLAGGSVGCLTVVTEEPATWGAAHSRALEAFAGLVSSVLATAAVAEARSRLADQLQHALDHRVTIERAIGYLMASRSVDAVAAFTDLRRTARSTRRKVAEVAEHVLGTGSLDGFAAGGR